MSNSLRDLIRCLLEQRVDPIKTTVAKDILALSSTVFRLGKGDKGEVRLQPKSPDLRISPDEIRDLFRLAGHPVEKEVAKQSGSESRSGKFVTYWTTTGVPVVIASGGNSGHKFERTINDMDFNSEELKSLQKALGLHNVISKEPGPAHVKRPLKTTAYDVGPLIADLVFKTSDDSPIFVSLKDPNGSTFGNFGIVGMFGIEHDKVIPRPHHLDAVLMALGIDKQFLSDGLSDFISGNSVDVVDDSPTYDPQLVRGILESGYGYGYWYARKVSNGWHCIDLTTNDKLSEHVGDARVEKISYPGKSKQCSVWVSTSTGGVYKFEIRNTKGKILPNEIKLKVLKGAKFDI